MTTKEKIFYGFSILFVSVVINFFVINLSVSKSGQREEIRALLKATDAIFTSLDYLNRKGPEIPEIKEEIEKARSALRSSKLLQIRLESY
ncbi:MAG: hypothetical protein ACHQYQ_10870 [Bacteriovoracales bacterium]|jgi:hypothetical protein